MVCQADLADVPLGSLGARTWLSHLYVLVPGVRAIIDKDECSPPAWGGRLAAALAMFLRRSQCTRAATRPLSHSATQPIRCSATRPISHLDSAAMAGIIFYSADQKWQPWSPQNNR